MKRKCILNPKLEKILQKKQHIDLSIRLKSMKPQVDAQCPESFVFYKTLFRPDKIQQNSLCKKILAIL